MVFTLTPIADLKGDQGPQGPQGPAGPTFNGGIVTSPVRTSTSLSYVGEQTNTGAPADARTWRETIQPAAGDYTIEKYNDAGAWIDTPLRLYRSGVRVDLAGIGYLKGTGMPEGVVTALVGSRYIDTVGTNGAVEWIKVAGTGNTGWKVAYGETGTRVITGLLVNGWTAGFVQISRSGSIVTIAVEVANAAAATSDVLLTIPDGFVPPETRRSIICNDPASRLRTLAATRPSLRVLGFSTSDVPYGGSVTYATRDPWPTALPGTAF